MKAYCHVQIFVPLCEPTGLMRVHPKIALQPVKSGNFTMCRVGGAHPTATVIPKCLYWGYGLKPDSRWMVLGWIERIDWATVGSFSSTAPSSALENPSYC